MFKPHKKKLIISSIVTLLPILFGLLLWDRLPDMMTTHWGIDNQPDGWTSKAFAVFGMPFILLAMQWLSLWITKFDKRQQNQSPKAMAMIFWLIPMISLFSSATMYSLALGNTVNIASIMFIMMGLMFAGIGNYLPKTKQNYTLGIKVIWALRNEENWNATHRFGGKVWVIGGIGLALTGFFPMDYAVAVMVPIIVLLALLPSLYSYLYYRKMCREGRGYSLQRSNKDKNITRISIVCVILILSSTAYILFSGDIACSFDETSFTILSNHYDDLTVEYDTVDSIELRNEAIPGTRSFGFGSARLLLGVFENEEFGLYTRYTYTKCECAIVIHSGGKVLVLAARTPEDTAILYEALLTKIGME